MNEEILLRELKHIKEQLDFIISALRGDPSDETKPGLYLRVDRLEQSKRAHNRILWTLISFSGVVLSTIVGALFIRYL